MNARCKKLESLDQASEALTNLDTVSRELSFDQLEVASGGLSLSYGQVEVKYVAQK
jgi:hypothetical protein